MRTVPFGKKSQVPSMMFPIQTLCYIPAGIPVIKIHFIHFIHTYFMYILCPCVTSKLQEKAVLALPENTELCTIRA